MKKTFYVIFGALLTIGITVHGASILQVYQGGTGAATLTGCLSGNGTSAITGNGVACGSGGTGRLDFATTTDTLSIYNSWSKLFGFGTTTPWGKLSVNPTALGSGVPEFVVGSSSATHFVVDGAGNVGIGTTNPQYNLDILSNGLTLARVKSTNAALVSGFAAYNETGLGDFLFAVQNSAIGGTYFGGAASNNNSAVFITEGNLASLGIGNAGNIPIFFGTNNLARVTILGNGNMGVGTTSPGSLLSVGGSTTGINFYDNGTSTFSGKGINLLNGGCFAIAGTCISGSGGGSGTVTSVGLSLPPAFTVTNSPVTTSGTLTATLAFPNNAVIGASSDGTNLVATGTASFLTIHSLNATSTTATSTIWGRLAVGTTTPLAQGASTFSVKGLMASVAQFLTSSGTKVMEILDTGVVNLLGTWDFSSATLKVPNAADPTVNATGIFALNTTLASTSLRAYDGTAERAFYNTYDKSFNFASSSMAYDGVTATASSTTYLMANSFRPQTLMSLYCKTKSGTVWVDYGNGTTASSTVNCTTSGASSSANPTFTMRQDQYMQLGKTTGTLGDLTITATFRNDAD